MIRTLEERLGAAYGAAAGVLMLCGVISETVNVRWWCGQRACRIDAHGGQNPVWVPAWLPFVDNPVSDGSIPNRQGPACARAAIAGAALESAVMPPSFDPRSRAAEGLYVCALVARDGSVLSAYLVGARLLSKRDRAAILELVRRDWRFRSNPDRSPGWQRVRLFDGPLPVPLPLV